MPTPKPCALQQITGGLGVAAWQRDVVVRGPAVERDRHDQAGNQHPQTLTRRSANGGWCASSAHYLWIGDHTRQLDGAHVAYAEGLSNPLGVKLGPTVTGREVIALCERLDPGRTPGRLSLITCMGAPATLRVLPGLVRAVSAAGYPVTWICDPMHANTMRRPGGHKTRRMADILAEIRAFFAVHHSLGTWPGGLLLEATAEDVTECSGGWRAATGHDPGGGYRSACDPRLNPSQALECLLVVLENSPYGKAISHERFTYDSLGDRRRPCRLHHRRDARPIRPRRHAAGARGLSALPHRRVPAGVLPFHTAPIRRL
jgi:hypothetical protein